MQLHLLTNFEVQTSYQNEPKFNGLYLMVFISPLEEYKLIRNYWIVFHVNGNNVTIF